MEKILRDIPLEGKVTGLIEDTVSGSFGRTELRTILIINNEVFGVEQRVVFIRGAAEKGDLLKSLINDVQTGKELFVEGKISYSLYVSGGFFARKEDKRFFKNVKHLWKTTNWPQLSESDKKILKYFIGSLYAPYWGALRLMVSVDGHEKYVIFANDTNVWGAKIYIASATLKNLS